MLKFWSVINRILKNKETYFRNKPRLGYCFFWFVFKLQKTKY